MKRLKEKRPLINLNSIKHFHLDKNIYYTYYNTYLKLHNTSLKHFPIYVNTLF